MGDSDYIHAFQKIVLPIAMEFSPELVISMLSLADALRISLSEATFSFGWV